MMGCRLIKDFPFVDIGDDGWWMGESRFLMMMNKKKGEIQQLRIILYHYNQELPYKANL